MKVALTRSGDEITIVLNGDLTEHANPALQDLLQKIELPEVVFDTRRVELINSLGARHWIDFMKTLLKRQVKISIKHCSPAFVECCNLYPKFAPSGVIKSVCVPCVCDGCGVEEEIVVDAHEFSDQQVVSSKTCSKCGSPWSPVVDMEEYMQCVK